MVMKGWKKIEVKVLLGRILLMLMLMLMLMLILMLMLML